MRFVDILSSDLPEIDDSVKKCINLGQWLLIKIDDEYFPEIEACFYLKVGNDFFALGEKGEIITTFHSIENDVHINEIISFSDLPKPESLSNFRGLNTAINFN